MGSSAGDPPGVPAGARAVALAQPAVSWAAGLAVAAASTALAGVLAGWTWLGAVIVTVGLVVLTGTVLRALRLPPGLVVVGQLLAVSCLLTVRFTADGLLGILPTPEAGATIGRLIGDGAGQIAASAPPVPTTVELLVLVTIAVGVIAIAVDVLAVPGRAPAGVGLVLLGVVAIPVALVDVGLPAWTLACGAVGFAVLLASNRSRWGRPGWAAATAGALALALAVGTLATGVGTSGRLSSGAPGAGALGLNPFTSLRGALDNPGSFELFQVRGMTEPGYLRAVTLAEYVPQRGWQIGDTGDTEPLSDPLPGTGDATDATQVELQVTNVAYRDNWLPLYGVPLGVSGLDGDAWRYDPLTGVARSDSPRQEAGWRQRAAIPQAPADELRQAPDQPSANRGRLDDRYSDTWGIDDRVKALAREVTRDAGTDFDRAVALNEYFLNPANGFRYSLQTAPGNSGDALVDFLTRGRVGYCEQYASAMAVMLRAVGVPSRVAVGFTAGVDNGQFRSISSRDAHAWVEAYFPGHGWLTFDPTPLADGRGVVPPYVAEATGRQAGAVPAEPQAQEPPPTPGAPEPAPAEDPVAAEPPPAEPPVPAGVVWAVLGVLGAGALAAAPAALRSLARRRRLAAAASGGAAGASAGWQEVIAESVDRKHDLPPSDTVRTAAERMIERHALDPIATEAMWRLAAAVEDGWYAERGPDGERLVAAVLGVTEGLRRCAPLGPIGRLLPRSLLHGASIRRLAINWAGGTRAAPEREQEPAALGR
jgi:transglutaminase-like putative cysteine protease